MGTVSAWDCILLHYNGERTAKKNGLKHVFFQEKKNVIGALGDRHNFSLITSNIVILGFIFRLERLDFCPPRDEWSIGVNRESEVTHDH